MLNANKLEGNRFTTEWTARADLPFFQGHFPGRPILPAVVTLEKSREFLITALACANDTTIQIKSAKFLGPILPDSALQIRIDKNSRGYWEVIWTLLSDSSQVLAKIELEF